MFSNTSNTPVRNAFLGDTVVESGLVVAGLYYTTDLSAVPLFVPNTDIVVPEPGWFLASVTPVSPSPALNGVYAGGQVQIPGISGGTQVQLQVRAWNVGYTSYEDAFNSGEAFLLGGSNTGIVTLGGGTQPTPSTSSFVQSFSVGLVPEPSTLALGLLGGLSGLLLVRRRRAALQSRSG